LQFLFEITQHKIFKAATKFTQYSTLFIAVVSCLCNKALGLKFEQKQQVPVHREEHEERKQKEQK